MPLALPLFHLYGDPPDDQAFDFIHVETISSRSSVHDWTIRAHRHRNLFQILLIERGGGQMTVEAATLPFAAPAAILMPATVAHGYRFTPHETEGWVVSFTEDVTHGLRTPSGQTLTRPRPRSRPSRWCRSRPPRPSASPRSAPIFMRSVFWHAKDFASPCVAIWRCSPSRSRGWRRALRAPERGRCRLPSPPPRRV